MTRTKSRLKRSAAIEAKLAEYDRVRGILFDALGQSGDEFEQRHAERLIEQLDYFCRPLLRGEPNRSRTESPVEAPF